MIMTCLTRAVGTGQSDDGDYSKARDNDANSLVFRTPPPPSRVSHVGTECQRVPQRSEKQTNKKKSNKQTNKTKKQQQKNNFSASMRPLNFMYSKH